jgi:hypothetical protein
MIGFQTISRTPGPRSQRRLVALGALAALLAGFVVSRCICVSSWIRLGVLVPRCPDGDIGQVASFRCSGLRRGAEGTIWIGAVANYTTSASDAQLVTPVRRFEPVLTLVEPKGQEVRLLPTNGWQGAPGFHRTGLVALPRDLPDGDYVPRAQVRSPLGNSTVDPPFPTQGRFQRIAAPGSSTANDVEHTPVRGQVRGRRPVDEERLHQKHVAASGFAHDERLSCQRVDRVVRELAPRVAPGNHGQGAVRGRRVVEVEAQGHQPRQHGGRRLDLVDAQPHRPVREPRLVRLVRDREAHILVPRDLPIGLGVLVEQGGVDR